MSELSNAGMMDALPPTTAGDRVLEAALAVFSLYGFRRTGMGLVAEQAGLSRPALYLRYANKEALFQAVARALVDRALARGRSEWSPDLGLAATLSAVILARDLELFRLLNTTPHGADLLSVDQAATAEGGRRLSQGFNDILSERAAHLSAAGELELGVYGGAEAFANLVFRLAAGLKHEIRVETDYIAAVHDLARLFERAER